VKRIRAWMLRRLPGFHPRMDELLAWADATATGRELLPHLTRCRRCRETALRIRCAVARAADQAAPVPALDETLDELQIRMQAWTSLSEAVSIRRAAPLGCRTAHRQYSALETYFGTETADRVLHSARRDTTDHRLMPAAEPLFHAFLGRRAAEALVRQIAGTAA
jgi:hypothetical protein